MPGGGIILISFGDLVSLGGNAGGLVNLWQGASYSLFPNKKVKLFEQSCMVEG